MQFFKNASFGGLSSVLRYGAEVKANCVYLDDFKTDEEQRLVLPLDENGMYGFQMGSPAPWTNYQYHDRTSVLVSQMNSRLKDSSFCSFYEDRVTRFNEYFMIEADLTFPIACQRLLAELCPVIRKCSVGEDMLSHYQLEMVKRMKMKLNPEPINIADFKPQRQILYLEYLTLLQKLGVQIVRVTRVVSALAWPIFKGVSDKILHLKENATTDYQKSLCKMLSNASFGFLLLKVESFKISKLLATEEAIKNAIMMPTLDHFLLLSSGSLMAYFEKRSVTYTSLLPLGVNVLQRSKKSFIERWYFSIRPILAQNSWRHEILMVDTDSLYLSLTMDSLDRCKKPLLLSDVLYELRHYLDLSFLVSTTGGQKCLYLEELERRADVCMETFMEEIIPNFHKTGKLKLELPHLIGSYFAIVRSIIVIREKAYRLDILFKKTSHGETLIGCKVTAKCGIPRKRMERYSQADFLKIIASRDAPECESSLASFRSKGFRIYNIEREVKKMTTFSRKRYIERANDVSYPYYYFKIRKLNDEDCDADS